MNNFKDRLNDFKTRNLPVTITLINNEKYSGKLSEIGEDYFIFEDKETVYNLKLIISIEKKSTEKKLSFGVSESV